MPAAALHKGIAPPCWVRGRRGPIGCGRGLAWRGGRKADFRQCGVASMPNCLCQKFWRHDDSRQTWLAG